MAFQLSTKGGDYRSNINSLKACRYRLSYTKVTRWPLVNAIKPNFQTRIKKIAPITKLLNSTTPYKLYYNRMITKTPPCSMLSSRSAVSRKQIPTELVNCENQTQLSCVHYLALKHLSKTVIIFYFSVRFRDTSVIELGNSKAY